MADLESVLADVSYLMTIEKSRAPNAKPLKKVVLPDARRALQRWIQLLGVFCQATRLEQALQLPGRSHRNCQHAAGQNTMVPKFASQSNSFLGLLLCWLEGGTKERLIRFDSVTYGTVLLLDLSFSICVRSHETLLACSCSCHHGWVSCSLT